MSECQFKLLEFGVVILIPLLGWAIEYWIIHR